MIFDHFNNLNRYHIPLMEKIQKFVSENNCLILPNEQINIDDKNLFVRVMEYQPKPSTEKNFETHQIYMDLQYLVSGVELIQTAPSEVLKPVSDYDVKEDYQFFKAERDITNLIVHAGEFTVFYPGEAHRPGCIYHNYHSTIKKLVFKIKIN